MKPLQIFDNIYAGLADGTYSVHSAVKTSCHLLHRINIPCQDVYESIDVLASLARNDYILNAPKALVHEIPQSTYRARSERLAIDSVANSLRIVCGNKSRINHQHSLKYWVGKRVSVFYDPLMIGFSCEEDLSVLGWGSMYTASSIASASYRFSSKSDFCFRRVAVILTRHASKYAHFIRDRLTKIIWAHYLSEMGPFDEYIFDYPLSDCEIKCLIDLGINARFSYACHLGRIFTISADLVIVVEISSGLNLLPLLKGFLLKKIPVSSARKKIFLSRGLKGSRRNALNVEEVEETMTKLGYDVVDLSDLGYVDQLSYCLGSHICAGIHGAQIINGLLTRNLIEIHSFPYCKSSWSQTMLRMADILNIPYVPLLLSSRDHNDTACHENTRIGDMQNCSNSVGQHDGDGQTSTFPIDITNLLTSVSLAESLLKKFQANI